MKLVIEDEAGTRSIVPFTGDEIVVGRAGGEGVTFKLSDRNVSRRHARFVRQNGATFVEDLGSLTGTRVNGEKIGSRRKLRQGDLVQIGDYDLAVMGDITAVAPGEPPPLPAGATLMLEPIPDAPAPAAAAHTVAAPASPAVPTAAPPRPPEPFAAGRRTFRVALAAGAIALALGVAAGWAFGFATAPDPPQITRP